MGPSSTNIDHDRLHDLIKFILGKPEFTKFAKTQASGFDLTTPSHIEEVSYKLLKYIVDESKALGGTRSNRKKSKHYTRRRG
jgi:hypothetical protein